MMFILNLGGLLTWVERKQSAIMQDRIGANRASIRIPFTRIQLRALGLFHPLADAIKMLTKEDFLPARADRLLYQLAPFVSVFSGWAPSPWSRSAARRPWGPARTPCPPSPSTSALSSWFASPYPACSAGRTPAA